MILTRKQAVLAFLTGVVSADLKGQTQQPGYTRRGGHVFTETSGPVYGIGFASDITELVFEGVDRIAKLSMNDIMDALGAPPLKDRL